MGGGVSWADPEAIYNLHLILKTMYKIHFKIITAT